MRSKKRTLILSIAKTYISFQHYPNKKVIKEWETPFDWDRGERLRTTRVFKCNQYTGALCQKRVLE